MSEIEDDRPREWSDEADTGEAEGVPPTLAPYEVLGTSARWHCVHNGKTYIAYAPDLALAISVFARKLGTTEYEILDAVKPSGHYDYSTNTIEDAQDGPHVCAGWMAP